MIPCIEGKKWPTFILVGGSIESFSTRCSPKLCAYIYIYILLLMLATIATRRGMF